MELLAQLRPLLPSTMGSGRQRLRQLWPFFRHSLAPVRRAATRLFISLVASSPDEGEHYSERRYSFKRSPARLSSRLKSSGLRPLKPALLHVIICII